MNKLHTIKQGDTLSGIAKLFYGNGSLYPRIVRANPQIKDPNSVPIGEVLIIPEFKELTRDLPKNVLAENDEKITALIDNKNFSFWNNFSIKFSLDSIDSFSLSAPFDPDVQVYRDVFVPTSYKDISLFLGEDIIFNGTMVNVLPRIIPTSNTLAISGYSLPGVLQDCTYPSSAYPLEFNNLNLQEIAIFSAEIFNIEVEFETDPGPKFERVAPGPTEKVLDFLVKLARQRGLIVSNTLDGKLLFRITNNTEPIANIIQGEYPFISCTPIFQAQNYYSHITGQTNTTASDSSDSVTEKNTFLINQAVIRPFTFAITDVTNSNINESTKAKMGHMFGNSIKYSLTIQGHRNINGIIWKDNQYIVVRSPGAMIYNDTKFIIKNAVLTRTVDSGDVSILELVLPEAYENKIPERVPWEQ